MPMVGTPFWGAWAGSCVAARVAAAAVMKVRRSIAGIRVSLEVELGGSLEDAVGVEGGGDGAGGGGSDGGVGRGEGGVVGCVEGFETELEGTVFVKLEGLFGGDIQRHKAVGADDFAAGADVGEAGPLVHAPT